MDLWVLIQQHAALTRMAMLECDPGLLRADHCLHLPCCPSRAVFPLNFGWNPATASLCRSLDWRGEGRPTSDRSVGCRVKTHWSILSGAPGRSLQLFRLAQSKSFYLLLSACSLPGPVQIPRYFQLARIEIASSIPNLMGVGSSPPYFSLSP